MQLTKKGLTRCWRDARRCNTSGDLDNTRTCAVTAAFALVACVARLRQATINMEKNGEKIGRLISMTMKCSK